MCPIFRFAPAEEASPRAKANLMRGVLTGQLDAATLTSDEFKTVADLCVNCHMCRLECPAGVDIPKLMIEAKAAYVAANGLRLDDWLLTRLDLLGSLGRRCCARSPIGRSPTGSARWLLEKTLGIAQGRKLPRFAARSFLRRAARRRLTRPTRRSGRKVLYFVDTYANYLRSAIGRGPGRRAGAQRRGGLRPPRAAAVGHGDDLARRARPRPAASPRTTCRILAEAVRQGYTIVATEPSAALCLTHEYPMLVDDDDTRLVADNTSEACTYLWQLHQTGKLQLDLKPINATLGYHSRAT